MFWQVRLYFAKVKYDLRLGQLISVWTTFVFHGEHDQITSASAPFSIKMFPERDESCHFRAYSKNDIGLFRSPIRYGSGRCDRI